MGLADNDNIVPNPTIGGFGGRYYAVIGQVVHKLEVWYDLNRGGQDAQVLRGIKLT